jgi:LemA protein
MEVFLGLLLAVAVVGLGIKVYNDLSPLWHRIEEAAANIEVVLNKRIQLTNRLSEIAGRYVGHERLIHLQISADRARAGRALRQGGQGINFFTGLASSFPELRADQTYLRLMTDLSSLEGEVQNRYELHNSRAREYNAKRSSLPTLLYAGFLGFNIVRYLDPSARYQLNPPPHRLRIRHFQARADY